MNMLMKLKIPNTGWEFLDNISECHLDKRYYAPMISLANWLIENKTDFSVFGNSSLVKKECCDHKSCLVFVISLVRHYAAPNRQFS
jgi:hypothetical protein